MRHPQLAVDSTIQVEQSMQSNAKTRDQEASSATVYRVNVLTNVTGVAVPIATEKTARQSAPLVINVRAKTTLAQCAVRSLTTSEVKAQTQSRKQVDHRIHHKRKSRKRPQLSLIHI